MYLANIPQHNTQPTVEIIFDPVVNNVPVVVEPVPPADGLDQHAPPSPAQFPHSLIGSPSEYKLPNLMEGADLPDTRSNISFDAIIIDNAIDDKYFKAILFDSKSEPDSDSNPELENEQEIKEYVTRFGRAIHKLIEYWKVPEAYFADRISEPKTYQETITCLQAELWRQAMREELAIFTKMQTLLVSTSMISLWLVLHRALMLCESFSPPSLK